MLTDRRGIVTPEYRAEQERVSDDSVITSNKTYGTVKIVQPQVIRYLICWLYYLIISFFIVHCYSPMVQLFKQIPAQISQVR